MKPEIRNHSQNETNPPREQRDEIDKIFHRTLLFISSHEAFSSMVRQKIMVGPLILLQAITVSAMGTKPLKFQADVAFRGSRGACEIRRGAYPIALCSTAGLR